MISEQILKRFRNCLLDISNNINEINENIKNIFDIEIDYYNLSQLQEYLDSDTFKKRYAKLKNNKKTFKVQGYNVNGDFFYRTMFPDYIIKQLEQAEEATYSKLFNKNNLNLYEKKGNKICPKKKKMELFVSDDVLSLEKLFEYFYEDKEKPPFINYEITQGFITAIQNFTTDDNAFCSFDKESIKEIINREGECFDKIIEALTSLEFICDGEHIKEEWFEEDELSDEIINLLLKKLCYFCDYFSDFIEFEIPKLLLFNEFETAKEILQRKFNTKNPLAIVDGIGDMFVTYVNAKTGDNVAPMNIYDITLNKENEENGKPFLDGDIEIPSDLEDLSSLNKYEYINGNLIVKWTNLKTLQGCPKIINGDIIIEHCEELISIGKTLKEIKGKIICDIPIIKSQLERLKNGK